MTAPKDSATNIVDAHPIDSVLRADRLPHILCPGCGIGTVIHCYAEAMLESGIELNRHICVSGIGCSGRAAGYVNVDSYHTTHGRAIPFALGIAVQKPELEVTVISGDGDLTAIGGNHLIHAARRNVDLNVICINNYNYGMTGGQAGPTTPPCARTHSTPYGSWDSAFNLPLLARSVGATFVARWTVLHVRQLKQAMLHAMTKKGFNFIEVVSPCPTGFGRPNDVRDGLTDMQRYRKRCMVDDNANLSTIDLDILNEDSPIVIGNFVDSEREIFRPAQPAPPPPSPTAVAWASVQRALSGKDKNGA